MCIHIPDTGNRREPPPTCGWWPLNAQGEVTASIDPLGNRTSFVFDKVGRLIEVLNSDGSRSTHTYAGGFPVDGEGLRRSAHEPGGDLTTFIWDGSDYLMEKTP